MWLVGGCRDDEKAVKQNAGQRNRNLSWRFAGNIPFMRQYFQCHCVQTVRYHKSLHYFEIVVDVSAGSGSCAGGNLFAFFCICQVGTKENKYPVYNQGQLTIEGGKGL